MVSKKIKKFKLPKGKKWATVAISLSKEEIESCKDLNEVKRKATERFNDCALPSLLVLVDEFPDNAYAGMI